MVLNNNWILYPPIYYRVLFYLFCAHFMVSYGEAEGLFELLSLPYYYPALMGSFLITVIIAEYILTITKYLDRMFPRFYGLGKRIVYQIFWGIFSTILVAITMAALYFWMRGTNIISAGYFRYDFTVVSGFIMFLNTLYLAIGLVQYRNLQFKTRIPNREKPKAFADANENIVAIYPVERGFVAILKSGESVIWSKTIEQTLKELPEEEYFLINRSDIIHKSIIAGYQPGDSRRLKLILKEPLTSRKVFMVSQRKVVAFKRWYKNDLR